MITDEMLRKAAAESEERFLADLPETHEFSEGFLRRVDLAKRRSLQRGRSAVRCVTLILAACLTVFGGVLGLSPEIRARVLGGHTATQPSEQVPVFGEDFCLTLLPEGNSEYLVVETSMGKTYLRVDSVNSVISYKCDWE